MIKEKIIPSNKLYIKHLSIKGNGKNMVFCNIYKVLAKNCKFLLSKKKLIKNLYYIYYALFLKNNILIK